jgi:nucleoside-diphosphate-sugar epimerase
MNRVLVTGASGFIGRYCLQPLLDLGYEVHAIRHGSRATSTEAKIRWHQCDLLERSEADALMEEVKPTHLLHLAWVGVPTEYWTSLENLSWVRSSLCLLEAFAKAGGHRIVIAGTCAEYDWRYGFLSESVTPLRPAHLYGACKASLAEIVSRTAPLIKLSWACGRVFYLYGPHEAVQRLVPSVTLSLLRGERAVCTHGRQLRDYSYVEDVARAFVMLLSSDVEGAINVGSGEAVSIREIVSQICHQTGAMGRADFGAVRAQQNDPPLVLADNRRLREELGWSPKWTLEQGIRATVEWWREHATEVREPRTNR